MKPPWVEFPDYAPGCLGWRMGAGEDYIDKWNKWMREIGKDGREIYLAANPFPPGWEWVTWRFDAKHG